MENRNLNYNVSQKSTLPDVIMRLQRQRKTREQANEDYENCLKSEGRLATDEEFKDLLDEYKDYCKDDLED